MVKYRIEFMLEDIETVTDDLVNVPFSTETEDVMTAYYSCDGLEFMFQGDRDKRSPKVKIYKNGTEITKKELRIELTVEGIKGGHLTLEDVARISGKDMYERCKERL